MSAGCLRGIHRPFAPIAGAPSSTTASLQTTTYNDVTESCSLLVLYDVRPGAQFLDLLFARNGAAERSEDDVLLVESGAKVVEVVNEART